MLKPVFELKMLRMSIKIKWKQHLHCRIFPFQLMKENLAIVGPNGSGKSTLLKLILAYINRSRANTD